MMALGVAPTYQASHVESLCNPICNPRGEILARAKRKIGLNV
jgi:hypothetical protein